MSGGGGGSGANSPYGTQTVYQNQQHLAKRYTKTGVIGRGTYGTVFRGIDNEDVDKREVAIKVMDLESIEDDINNIMQEIIALRDCQSEHVPKYYHSFNIGPELWIVMEFMGGGSVQDYLEPKEQIGLEEEHLIKIILREVTKGLAYLHSLKMIHRDIKAANILLSDNGNVKLADFGVVGRLTETIEKRMTMIGSPYWMAPEVIVPEKGKDDGYGTPADIWSLGILGMEIANGIPPHGDQHPFEAMRRIMEGPPPKLEDNPEWSDEFREFLSGCLVKDPKKRLTANELLKLDFFKDCGDLSVLKEELIDAMKEFENYDFSYEDNDEESKFNTMISTDETGSVIDYEQNQGTLEVINDGDAVRDALRNDDVTNEQSPNATNIGSGSMSSVDPVTKTDETSNTTSTTNNNNPNTKTINLSQHNSPNTSVTGINASKQLKKPLQKSQSSRHVMRLSGVSPIGAAVPGPRHSRQFSKRKSTAAAIRAHRKLSKQKSFNMSIEWTYSTRTSMLQVPSTGSDQITSPVGSSSVDLYGDTPEAGVRASSISKKKGKSKSAMSGSLKQPSNKEDTLSDESGNNDEWEFDGGTMVKGGPTNILLDPENSNKSNPKPIGTYRQVSIPTYDIGIQTDHKNTYDKSVQTETHTVAHLVGIRKDIISICESMETELTDKGKEYLENLKSKIREMTHLKITERRMKSINIEDAQEAQRRKNEIRAQSQVLSGSDIQQTQDRLRDLREKMNKRPNSKNKI